MHKYLTELIGSFFIVLTIGMSVLTPGAGASAPIAIGLMVMALIFASAQRAQWHYYNPALSLADGLARRQPWLQIGGHGLAQVVGALLAVPIILYFKRAPIPLPDNGALPVVLAEGLFTFALAYATLALAHARQEGLRAFVPIVVGALVIASAYAVGAVSGAMVNPAVTIAMYATGLLEGSVLPAYLAAQFVAAFLAWSLWSYLRSE